MPRGKRKVNPEFQELDRYRLMAGRVYTLSQVAVRQFTGSRPDEDPRVQFMKEIEAFQQVAKAQLAVLARLMTEKLGIKKEDYLAMACEELENQVKVMQEDLAVRGWDQDGKPIFDLEAFKERTAGWPP